MIRTEIVFDIVWSGWRRVHAASDENGVNKITSYPDSRQSHVNVRRMDLVVIQYRTVRVGLPDKDAWRMLVSDWNACSGMRSLRIVEWERSTIVTSEAVGQSNQGKYTVTLRINPLLPQSIREITYICW